MDNNPSLGMFKSFNDNTCQKQSFDIKNETKINNFESFQKDKINNIEKNPELKNVLKIDKQCEIRNHIIENNILEDKPVNNNKFAEDYQSMNSNNFHKKSNSKNLNFNSLPNNIGNEFQDLKNENFFNINNMNKTNSEFKDNQKNKMCPNFHNNLLWDGEKRECQECEKNSYGFYCNIDSYFICFKCYDYSILKTCPHSHELRWVSNKKCFNCCEYNFCLFCEIDNYSVCYKCYSYDFRQILCPNKHEFKFYNFKSCFLCKKKNKCLGCEKDDFYLCLCNMNTNELEVPINLESCSVFRNIPKFQFKTALCILGHKLIWKKLENICYRCENKNQIGMFCEKCELYSHCINCYDFKYPVIDCPNNHGSQFFKWISEKKECMRCNKSHTGYFCTKCEYFICRKNCVNSINYQFSGREHHQDINSQKINGKFFLDRLDLSNNNFVDDDKTSFIDYSIRDLKIEENNQSINSLKKNSLQKSEIEIKNQENNNKSVKSDKLIFFDKDLKCSDIDSKNKSSIQPSNAYYYSSSSNPLYLTNQNNNFNQITNISNTESIFQNANLHSSTVDKFVYHNYQNQFYNNNNTYNKNSSYYISNNTPFYSKTNFIGQTNYFQPNNFTYKNIESDMKINYPSNAQSSVNNNMILYNNKIISSSDLSYKNDNKILESKDKNELNNIKITNICYKYSNNEYQTGQNETMFKPDSNFKTSVYTNSDSYYNNIKSNLNTSFSNSIDNNSIKSIRILDEKYIATTTNDSNIEIWNYLNGMFYKKIILEKNHDFNNMMYDSMYLLNEFFLLILNLNGVIFLYDIRKDTKPEILNMNIGYCYSLLKITEDYFIIGLDSKLGSFYLKSPYQTKYFSHQNMSGKVFYLEKHQSKLKSTFVSCDQKSIKLWDQIEICLLKEILYPQTNLFYNLKPEQKCLLSFDKILTVSKISENSFIIFNKVLNSLSQINLETGDCKTDSKTFENKFTTDNINRKKIISTDKYGNLITYTNGIATLWEFNIDKIQNNQKNQNNNNFNTSYYSSYDTMNQNSFIKKIEELNLGEKDITNLKCLSSCSFVTMNNNFKIAFWDFKK